VVHGHLYQSAGGRGWLNTCKIKTKNFNTVIEFNTLRKYNALSVVAVDFTYLTSLE
jgi:hypothetical protein